MAAIFPVGGLNTLLNIKQLSRRYTNEVDQGHARWPGGKKGDEMAWPRVQQILYCSVHAMNTSLPWCNGNLHPRHYLF